MRIFLADTPSSLSRLIAAMLVGHPYKLVSYWFLREDKDPAGVIAKLLEVEGQTLCIDSGMFSLMFGPGQGTIPNTYPAYRDFTRRYLEDLALWGVDKRCVVVESDAHRLLGMDAVHKLREEFKPYGDQVMYVWHEPEGIDGLVKLAREKSYIAIGLPELRHIATGRARGGGSGENRLVERMVNDLVRRIHEGCGRKRPPRIHLLGCTVNRMMETPMVWSCDSTSWLSVIRYGSSMIWEPSEGLVKVDTKSPRFERFREMAKDANPVATEFCAKEKNVEYYTNCMTSAYAWLCYQGWLDETYTPVPMRGA